LEEVAERGAVFAAAEPVGAERADLARHPLVDRVGQHLQIVRGGDEDAGGVLQALRHVRDARRFTGMQHVPTVARMAVAVQLLVARDRKSTRLNSSHEWISYAVFCLKKKHINLKN